MSKDGKADIVVAMPASATDLIKAIRELFGLVEDVAKGGKWVIDIYNGRQKRNAARNLERLSFTKAGTRPHLERIIAGEHTPADLEAIGRQVAETAAGVEAAISGLDRYREVVRETFGMEAGEKFRNLLYGPAGKSMIRHSLNHLVDYARRPDADPKVIRNRAKEALTFINQLNREFCEFHDLILSIEKKQR
jgi:hypothetical protein